MLAGATFLRDSADQAAARPSPTCYLANLVEGMMARTTRLAGAILASASLGLTISVAIAPAYAESNGVLHTRYDGLTNDLLTAGLGKTGLGSATPPSIADPLHPTAEEL